MEESYLCREVALYALVLCGRQWVIKLVTSESPLKEEYKKFNKALLA